MLLPLWDFSSASPRAFSSTSMSASSLALFRRGHPGGARLGPGAVRAELDGVYDNRIFISGFVVNAVVAVLLVFIGDRLSLDLYLVALINFGFRIFNNVALIRRHFI